jgi:L,D-transpeptidase YcbB
MASTFVSKTKKISVLLFSVIVLNNACKNGNSIQKPTEIIADIFNKDILDPVNIGKLVATDITNNAALVFQGDSIKNMAELQQLYKAFNNQPIWLTGDGVTKNGQDVLKNIIALQEDGINPQQLYVKQLQDLQQQILQKNCTDSIAKTYELGMSIACIKACKAMIYGQYNTSSYTKDWFNSNDTSFKVANYVSNTITKDSLAYLFKNLTPTLPEYAKFKAKLKELETIEKAGGWPLVSGLSDSLPIGFKNANIIKLRERLNKEIGVPKDVISNEMTTDVLTAINDFQYLHDLRLTGKLDTSTLKRLNQPIASKIKNIKSNLERIRWIQKDLHQPYVWVNVPKMDLEYIDNDSTQFKMKVVVGRTSRPTPMLNAIMSNVVINPGWNVPPTIMEEEVVPGIARRGGGYLSRRGLKAFYHGHEVDGSRINKNNYKAFSIQQKPGLNSALGAVKFNLPNPQAIYLHDTPHREDFVKYYRAYSSGCIRVSKPRDFAEFVINDSSYSKNNIDSMIRRKITKEVPLKQKVEVHIVYLTNGLDSLGNVLYLRDIYSKDAAMQGLWK